MAGNHPPPSQLTSPNLDSTTKVTDLDIDSLVHCASYLTLKDVSNMASSFKLFNQVAYSELVWRRLFRKRWPQLGPYYKTHSQLDTNFMSQTSSASARESYLARHTALQQLKFFDYQCSSRYVGAKASGLLFNKNSIYFTQGPFIWILNFDEVIEGELSVVIMDHHASITSMRLFPLKETSLFRNQAQVDENVLVTSSCDHSIRLWWKGSCKRCFEGHSGPVTILSDKLLGGKVFASGGEDNTVRLWSLRTSRKRDEHALKATLHGHEKPLVLMSVSGHNASLLATMSKDSKVRVWDTTVLHPYRSSSCVGTTSVPGEPVGMKCHDSLLYIASGSSFEAVDLRTMKSAFRTSTNQAKLHSFDIMPSKYVVCTGGVDRAMLWDIRRSRGIGDVVDPMAELGGHVGPITHLQMDPYKVVTGGPEDANVNIWDVGTGIRTNSMRCSNLHGAAGCSGVAANGFRIVTAGYNQQECELLFRDYNNSICSGSASEGSSGWKFWSASTSGHAYADDDESDG